MKPGITLVDGSIIAPQGFLVGGVHCDIKRLGTGKGSNKGRKRDLALIVSEVPATVAGMFTTNQVCAAPVKLCIPRAAKGTAQAIVVNSGNANACTGRQGMKDADTMTRQIAHALHMPPEHVLVASTGRIGVPLPMPNVKRGIAAALDELDDSPVSADHVAEAIMTSDTRPKHVAVRCRIANQTVHIGGVCKGAGMIQPGMSHNGKRPAASSGLHATMLCFLTTDAAVLPGLLQTSLSRAVATSFNRITVDGDMSTNDTVLILANGLAGHRPLGSPGTRRVDVLTFQTALELACLQLARMIVRDGEGVHRVVTVRVDGARSAAEADAAARAVANSPLVKTSWHGGDPNWGRIMDAIGYSPCRVIEDKVDIGYSAPESDKILWSVRHGQPTRIRFQQLCRAVAPTEFDLHIRLNLGRGGAIMYAADLTEQYVDFNKGDVSDPGALGG
jgi:glutamate N-acetyltransferase/amino-acid N-acetyltransferase